jgi:hypothetical protein
VRFTAAIENPETAASPPIASTTSPQRIPQALRSRLCAIVIRHVREFFQEKPKAI